MVEKAAAEEEKDIEMKEQKPVSESVNENEVPEVNVVIAPSPSS